MLTLQGWGLVLIGLALLIWMGIANVYPFLSISAPIEADVLVVEGWLPDAVLKKAIAEFNQGNYRMLITTGLPLSKGYYLVEYDNFAELTAATLLRMGVESDKLVAVPAPRTTRNRTATSAMALRQWLDESNLQPSGINVYSLGPHSRRSWLLFRKALAPDTQVGVIAARPVNYNPTRWIKSSEGVRSVISETIGYLYARLINWRE